MIPLFQIVFKESFEYELVKEELKYPSERKGRVGWKTGTDSVHPSEMGLETARYGAVREAQCSISIESQHAALFHPLRELCQVHQHKLRSCLVDLCGLVRKYYVERETG